MKVAVCSTGDTLDSPVDPRFGRCAKFVIVDADTMEFTTEVNPGATMGQGAGIQAAQMLSGQGVDAVVAGNYGPNAYQVLSAAGIKAFTGAGGSVGQAIEQLKAGALQEVTGPTAAGRFGMGQASPGAGTGMGQGRGGRGRGGFGRGRGGW